MAAKLGRNEMLAGHTRDDFECYGPVATKDTDFGGCKLADMGCFKQDEGTDSNKYYHCAVVKSKKTAKWFMYVEYGRTKNGEPSSPQYQFAECASEQDAMTAFAKQCAEKNTKRGQWEKIGSKERYVPKTKKGGATEDLYVIRVMASRAVGLPAAKNICNADAVGTPAPTGTATKAPAKKASARKLDTETRKLFKDLIGGAIQYTRSTLVGGAKPALSALSDADDLLQDAMARIKVVGDNVDDQVADAELKKLTYNLYGMVPKVKPLGAAESTWILSKDNILRWQDDIAAFKTGLQSANVEDADDGDDVMQGIPADVENIPMTSELGKFLTDWWIKNTRNKHGHGPLQVHNLWKVIRRGDDDIFEKTLTDTISEMPKTWNNERPMFIEKQKERPDLTPARREEYWQGNVFLGFHGTRAVNVPGIIRENLRIPNQLVGVVITGAMFGPGSYFADDWGKSANYCSTGGAGSLYTGSSGHVSGRRSFMFGVDVVLGNPHVAKDAHGFTAPPAGHHCVFGKAGHTASWGSYGGLQNNEWIIYRKGRCVLRYLAELSWY